MICKNLKCLKDFDKKEGIGMKRTFCSKECLHDYHTPNLEDAEMLKRPEYKPSPKVRNFKSLTIEERRSYQHWLRETRPQAFILYRARQGAKVKGRECSLELADIPVIPEFCPVLKWVRLEYRVGHGKAKDEAPSLDRIDNTKGYVKGNVRIISMRANRLKNNASDQELVALGKDAQKRLQS